MYWRYKMRWLTMVSFCVMVSSIVAVPDPKKYKHDSSEKDKKSETLTNDERKFLREVEDKFGVKSDVPVTVNTKKDQNEKIIESKDKESTTFEKKPPFPAVIAIEIVNDTESQSKDKRTIDANLGYGYRTNDGYSYSYFGKSNQDKGKFVIYPYSQEDPPSYSVPDRKYSYLSNGKYTPLRSTHVEIQPSQAYELVPVKNEQTSYNYKKPAIEFKTPASVYSNGKTAQTLYTTYNGHELSGLSGQFPTLMPNYFVDPSQLLKNPQYQNAGLTQDHLRHQNSYLNQNQRIVPVLVLRVPSSYLKNPTAELYPNLPTNYPLSQHLNSINLQGLVNQYFKKNGYSVAPNIMSYQSSSVPSSESASQHYSQPYVKPTYTQADYSGVQYSAVKPVMARYPSTYSHQKYLTSQPQSFYQTPVQKQYEYQYQYVPQTEVKMQTFYIQPQYQQSSQEAAASDEYQNQQSSHQHQSNVDESLATDGYSTPQHSNIQESKESSVDYETRNNAQTNDQPDVSQYVSANPESSNYASNNENIDFTKQQVTSEHLSASIPTYSSSPEYYSTNTPAQKNTVSVYPSRLIHTEQYQEPAEPDVPQDYTYSSQSEESGKSFGLSENYPSKDHTIATVLPYTYKSANGPIQTSVQTISYVTPMPNAKYQSKYRIMVPQTVLQNPNTEKVTYVNSRTLPMHYMQVGHYADSNSDNEYAAGSQYVSSVAGKPSYSTSFHFHPKRMAKPDSGTDVSSARVGSKKSNERNEKKKSS